MSGISAIARYVKMRTAMPLKGIGDSVHHIHASTEYDAELKFSDLKEVVNSHDVLVRALKDVRFISEDPIGLTEREQIQKLCNVALASVEAL